MQQQKNRLRETGYRVRTVGSWEVRPLKTSRNNWSGSQNFKVWFVSKGFRSKQKELKSKAEKGKNRIQKELEIKENNNKTILVNRGEEDEKMWEICLCIYKNAMSKYALGLSLASHSAMYTKLFIFMLLFTLFWAQPWSSYKYSIAESVSHKRFSKTDSWVKWGT